MWARLRLNAAHFRGSRKPVQGLRPTRQRWGTQGREAVPTLLEAQFPSAFVQQVLAFLRPREGSKSWNMDSLGEGPQGGPWQTCPGDQKSPRPVGEQKQRLLLKALSLRAWALTGGKYEQSVQPCPQRPTGMGVGGLQGGRHCLSQDRVGFLKI